MPRPTYCKADHAAFCASPHCPCFVAAQLERGNATGFFDFTTFDPDADYERVGSKQAYEWGE